MLQIEGSSEGLDKMKGFYRKTGEARVIHTRKENYF